jgi:2-polyprenyl-3-methyl-5-hydroxy-6-metoxy-1,4-benzoquinol methylase
LGYPVKAIDVDAASITEAQRASQFPHASFECADPLQFVGNPPYQVIILSEVLEHLTDPVAMLVHLRGLLAPGGTLVLTVPNGYGPWELMNWGKKGFAAVGLGPALRSFQRLFGFGKQTVQSRNPHLDHVQFFTTQSLSRVVQSAGFQIRRRANLSCLVAVFPVSWLFRRLKLLEPLDASLARLLPAVLVSGWLLELDAG